jgi:farnesyl-diphosphate farnesyltransferase
MEARGLLTELLRDVSRSFYFTLRVLPRRVRPQIGLAYLLARATDTIADTALVPVELRLDALEKLRACIVDGTGSPPDLSSFLMKPSALTPVQPGGASTGTATPAELILLGRIGEAIAVMRGLSTQDQSTIRCVLDTITSGQVLDLRRFARVPAGQVQSVKTYDELDDYIYRVAGCVGEFWTRICRTHIFPRAHVDEPFLLENGVRFGKGLQLTNILRDLPRDLRLGRCYLPETELQAASLTPGDLLCPGNEQHFRPIYERYCRIALEHLRAGWEYTNHIPRTAVRVRLACAWPILIGKRTLEMLSNGPILGERTPTKVSRRQLRSILIHSVLRYPWPSSWRRLWPEVSTGRQTR